MIRRLEAELRAMLGSDAGVGSAIITGEDGLLPEELPIIARAVPKRRAEFAAGRRAAREALSEVGLAPTALPVGAHRAPVWPEGVVGAITHDAGFALAAVARSDRLQGLGIDVTEAAPLPEKTRGAILPHTAEQGLSSLEERAAFSAKESLFKALFPVAETYFGFEFASVRVDMERQLFEIRLTQNLASFAAGQRWKGRISQRKRFIMTALIISRT